MTFKKWVIEKYINEDSPEGDFARDMQTVEDFPETKVYGYLRRCRACRESVKVYRHLRKQYRHSRGEN